MSEVIVNKVAIKLAKLQGVMGDAEFYREQAEEILKIVEGRE